jgi:hypothetical protein
MGSDDLHHKRKAKDAKTLQRRKSSRDSYDKILIVCEGEKTEPHYFKALVQHYRLNSANVEITGSCGSSPRSVLEKAEELAQKETARGDGYNRVYCVFDKDSHETYAETITKIDAKNPKDVFYAVVSVPCFEYWLLLHFKYTTNPYQATQNSSIANEVLKELKTVLPDYSKGDKDIFNALITQIEFAKQNAERGMEHSKKYHSYNPSTNIHELIHDLQTLKD